MNIEVKNHGLCKFASVKFSRRGIYYSVEAMSHVQSANATTPSVTSQVVQWETRNRLSGIHLADQSGFEKELASCIEACQMTPEELQEGLELKANTMKAFATAFYGEEIPAVLR